MRTNQIMKIKDNMYYNTELECWINLGEYIPKNEFLNKIPLKTFAIIDKCYRIIHNRVPDENDLLKAIENCEILYNDNYVWIVDSNCCTDKSICCRLDDCRLVDMRETLQGFGLECDYDLWKDMQVIIGIETRDLLN